MLEGSVQRDQNRVRVNAQLIDAETGAHLWADRFEEDVADLFKLQDEVVARLAHNLGWVLVNAEAEKGAHSKNPDAIDLAMRGWTLVHGSHRQPLKERLESIEEARALFDQALKIDPNDAEALAGSARVYGVEYGLGSGDPGTDYDAKVLGPADRAIALDPDNIRAYYTKSEYLDLSHRSSEGLGVADAGLAVNPNFAPLYSARAIAENSLGRYEQAKADLRAGDALKPTRSRLGTWHVESGRRRDRPRPSRRRDRRISARRSTSVGALFRLHAISPPPMRLRARWTRRRRAGGSAPPQSQTHGQVDDRTHAESAGRVRGLRKAGLPEE